MSKIKNRILIKLILLITIFCITGISFANEGVMHRFARAVFAIPKALLNSMSGPTPCGPPCGEENISIHFPYLYAPIQNQGQNLYYVAPPFATINQAPNYVTYKVIIPKNDPKLKDSANVHIYSSIPFDNQ